MAMKDRKLDAQTADASAKPADYWAISAQEALEGVKAGKWISAALAVLQPAQPIPTPETCYAEPAEPAYDAREIAVGGQGVPAGKNVDPVVITAAHQWQGLRARIGYVHGDVEEIFEKPDAGQGKAERFAPAPHHYGGDHREHELTQCAAVERDGLAKDTEKKVPGLMERQIGVIEDRQKPVGPGQQEERASKQGRGDQKLGSTHPAPVGIGYGFVCYLWAQIHFAKDRLAKDHWQ